jgi:hypothetical protein
MQGMRRARVDGMSGLYSFVGSQQARQNLSTMITSCNCDQGITPKRSSIQIPSLGSTSATTRRAISLDFGKLTFTHFRHDSASDLTRLRQTNIHPLTRSLSLSLGPLKISLSVRDSLSLCLFLSFSLSLCLSLSHSLSHSLTHSLTHSLRVGSDGGARTNQGKREG